MTTLQPRPPYNLAELAALYPKNLSLEQVQVVFRHGERTPVSPRLQNAGVPAHWPFCAAARFFKAAVLSGSVSAAGIPAAWETLPFERKIETFGPNGEAVLTGSPKDPAAICQLGELTDKGRATTLALGERLRHLYVDQLKFLPGELPADSSSYYLRATPIVRALESLHQVFTGLYPAATRDAAAPPVAIVTRNPADENLFPNDANCRRFNQLSHAFAERAAAVWNDSPEMAYLQKKLGRWVPRVAVDGHPRLSGIMDSVNATLAHGAAVRLPDEFYDPEVRRILNAVNVDEWYRGYSQSEEYRRLGVGSLLGDIKDRAVGVAAAGGSRVRLALMGCHDTTLAGLLATLGAFDQVWPPFTSSIAVETFRLRERKAGLMERVLGRNTEDGWFVRVRYNDQPVVVRACRKPGNHLEGDESFCTLRAFRETVEKVAPRDWKGECLMNLDKPGVPAVKGIDE